VFSGYVLMFATVVVGLWLTPFTLRFLDREEYAIFALMSDVLMWLGLLDLGIAAGLRAKAAQLTGMPDQERLNRLASTAFFSQNVVVAAVLLLGTGLSFAFPQFFAIRPELQRDAAYLLFLMIVALAMSMGTQTFSALLIANQQIHVDNAFGLLNLVIRSVLTVVLLKAGWGLYSLAIANLAAKLTSSSLAVLRTFRLLPLLRIRFKLASWEDLRGIGSLGLWFSLAGVANVIISGLDRLMTAKLVSVEMVTTLTLTGRLYSFSGGLILLLTDTARPMLGQLFGQKKLQEALRVYRQLFALSVGGAVVLGLCIWSGNGSFVSTWVGNSNYGGLWMDGALFVNFVIAFWIRPNRAALSAALTVRAPAICQIIEGFLNLGLSILFARPFGVLGIIVATSIASMMTSSWFLPYMTARMFNLSLGRFIWTDIFRQIILVASLVPIAFLARAAAMGVSGYGGAALGAFITGLAGLALLWFVVFDHDMRDFVRRNVIKIRRSVLQA
jgi:O-antigen/teichoic acid export membrane protein